MQAGSVALLGRSWGGLLAIEYAIRHPECVSQLILMNTAPASHDDYVRSRRAIAGRRAAGDTEALRRVASSTKFVQGDIASDLDYYRLHFRAALQAPEHLEAIVRRLRAHFTAAGIVKARAIEERLVNETWLSRDYDLMPRIGRLRVPALVLHGESDLFPLDVVARIARALPHGRLVVLPACGHFAYLERPDAVRCHVDAFLGGA